MANPEPLGAAEGAVFVTLDRILGADLGSFLLKGVAIEIVRHQRELGWLSEPVEPNGPPAAPPNRPLIQSVIDRVNASEGDYRSTPPDWSTVDAAVRIAAQRGAARYAEALRRLADS